MSQRYANYPRSKRKGVNEKCGAEQKTDQRSVVYSLHLSYHEKSSRKIYRRRGWMGSHIYSSGRNRMVSVDGEEMLSRVKDWLHCATAHDFGGCEIAYYNRSKSG